MRNISSAILILNGNESLKNVIDKFGINSPTIFEFYYGIYKLRFLKRKIHKQKIYYYKSIFFLLLIFYREVKFKIYL